MHLYRFITFLLLSFAVCMSKPFYWSFEEEFFNLAATSDNVYIGGNNSIILLNSSLAEITKKSMKGRNWLLVPFNYTNGNETVISCNKVIHVYNSECFVYIAGTLKSVFYILDIDIQEPLAKSASSIVGGKRTFTIASSSCLMSVDENRFAISHYEGAGFVAPHRLNRIDYTVNYKNCTNTVFFKTILEKDNYMYFLFVTKEQKSKLGRICTESNLNHYKVEMYEDISLQCNHNGINITGAHDAVYMNDFLLVSFSVDSESIVCRFKSSDIDNQYNISRKKSSACDCRQNSYFKRSFEACYDKATGKCETVILEENKKVANLISH